MPSQPETVNDTVLYLARNFYGDKDITVRMLDGSILDIWGPVFVNGQPLVGVGVLPIATQAEALAGADNTKVMTPLRVREAGDARYLKLTGGNLTDDLFIEAGQFLVLGNTHATRSGYLYAGVSGEMEVEAKTRLQFMINSSGKMNIDATDVVIFIPLVLSDGLTVNGTTTLYGNLDVSNGFALFDTMAATTIDVTDAVTVPDEVYSSGWNGSLEVPTKNAIYDKIESSGLYLNVRNYGAIGNGVADDTSAIQAACAAAKATGGNTVYLPAGTYKTTGTIAVPQYSALVGAGRTATTINYTGSGTAIGMDDPTTQEVKLNISMRDFTLNAPSAATGINCKWMKYSIIERCKVVGLPTAFPGATGSVGILFDGSWIGPNPYGCENNTVRHCWIRGWDTDILLDGIAGNGMSNINLIQDCYLGGFNIGIHIKMGSSNTIHHVNTSSYKSPISAVGIKCEGDTNLIDKQWVDTVACLIGVQMTSTANDNVVCNGSYFGSTGATCIQLDAGSQKTKLYGNRYEATNSVVDNTPNNLDGGVTVRSGALMPITFYQATTVAASLDQALTSVPTTGGVPIGRPYMVRGISLRLNSARTAGTITVTPTIGGVKSSTLSTSISTSTVIASNWQGYGKNVDLTGGLRLGVDVVTTAAWLPTANSVIAVAWIEFLDE